MEEEDQKTTFLELDDATKLQILSYLPPASLCRAALVNKELHGLAAVHTLWNKQLAAKLGVKLKASTLFSRSSR